MIFPKSIGVLTKQTIESKETYKTIVDVYGTGNANKTKQIISTVLNFLIGIFFLLFFSLQHLYLKGSIFSQHQQTSLHLTTQFQMVLNDHTSPLQVILLLILVSTLQKYSLPLSNGFLNFTTFCSPLATPCCFRAFGEVPRQSTWALPPKLFSHISTFLLAAFTLVAPSGGTGLLALNCQKGNFKLASEK